MRWQLHLYFKKEIMRWQLLVESKNLLNSCARLIGESYYYSHYTLCTNVKSFVVQLVLLRFTTKTSGVWFLLSHCNYWIIKKTKKSYVIEHDTLRADIKKCWWICHRLRLVNALTGDTLIIFLVESNDDNHLQMPSSRTHSMTRRKMVGSCKQNWWTYHDHSRINSCCSTKKCHCTWSTSMHCAWNEVKRVDGSVPAATAGCCHPPDGEVELLLVPLFCSLLVPSHNRFSPVSDNGCGDRTRGDKNGIAFGVSLPAAKGLVGILPATSSSWRESGARFCSLVGGFLALVKASLWRTLPLFSIGWIEFSESCKNVSNLTHKIRNSLKSLYCSI